MKSQPIIAIEEFFSALTIHNKDALRKEMQHNQKTTLTLESTQYRMHVQTINKEQVYVKKIFGKEYFNKQLFSGENNPYAIAVNKILDDYKTFSIEFDSLVATKNFDSNENITSLDDVVKGMRAVVDAQARIKIIVEHEAQRFYNDSKYLLDTPYYAHLKRT
jgi:hypothetical protein